MIHRKHRDATFALAAVLSLTIAGAANAAVGSAAPVEPAAQASTDVELAEIRVRGTRLADVIESAEDDFFKRYNRLNRDNKYDVSCTYMMVSDSLALTRQCLPGFLVDAMIEREERTRCYRFGAPPRTIAYQEPNGAYYFTAAPCVDTGSIAPPLSLVAMEHGKGYAVHVLMVINSDAQLREKAARLADLYAEMKAVQERYVEVRSVAAPARGPR